MGKTRTFQLLGNRVQFKCPTCKTRKYSSVRPDLRRISMRCSNCGEVTKCILDRRVKSREMHSGKIVMVTQGGKHLEVFLCDLSIDGIGINIPVKTLRSGNLKKGRQARFKCSWNPGLVNGNFAVSTIRDHRVGLQKV